MKNILTRFKLLKLSDVCNIQTGKYDANHEKPNGKYRFYTCAFEYMYCETKRFSGECIILPGNGANVGEVFYYNGDFDAYQRTYVLNKINIYPKYLYYHLLGNWRKRNQDKQFGSATNYIRMGNFTDYEISVPEDNFQLAIVSKIEELFSELDIGIKNLKTAQQQLKVYRQAVLKWAFEGKLTNENVKDVELPETWKFLRFGEIFSTTPQNGLYKASTEYGSGTPIIRIDGFYEGAILSDYEYKRVRLTKEEIEKYEIVEGDILVNRVNSMPYLGKCGIVKHLKERTVFESNIMKVKVDLKMAFPEYVAIYLSSQRGLKELRKNAKQAVNQASINQTDVSNVNIPLPKMEEQKLIVQEIENRLSVADKMEESINDSLKQAEALRQSILKKAFEGKLI
ncbi:MAG: putative type modification methyltransferase, subunit [Bacteroidetes bacterium]|jgi:type I restriction enzyme S subunit|nr:putative type modification methyltransferase, subunit [Bacteroidota bacterium]